MSDLGLIVNDTGYLPDDEVAEILEFAASHLGGLEQGRIACRVTNREGGGCAYAPGDNPKWAGRFRYAVTLSGTISKETGYGQPRACWHATTARETARGHGAPTMYEAWARAYERGERRYGRWPIYVIYDWREHLVHLAAHEFAHVLAYDRDRGKHSEIQCELFAERILNEWRRDHPPEPKEVPMTDLPTITLAEMGHGNVWHILAGHVTDDIMKTSCGLRAVPREIEANIDARAVRHRGANVCANCRVQLTNHEGGTTMSSTTITDELQARASEAAETAADGETPQADDKPAEPQAGSSGRSKAGTAATEKTKTRRRSSTKTSTNGAKPLSAIKAAEQILRTANKPLHVKELTEKILALPNTRLGGKTPDATVGAILAVDSKKPGSVFRRTKPGTYTIRKGK